MNEELRALVKEQEQLRAMKKSYMEFEKALQEKFKQFVKDYTTIEDNEETSIIELLARLIKVD